MYNFKKYPNSEKIYEEAKEIFAMGVGSQVQSFRKPHPIYMVRGERSKIYDVDGNEYIDYLLNYGPLILGHSPEEVYKAVKEQLKKGMGFGEPHLLQIELSKLLVEIVPCFEMVNFNNTGTEAVQASLRLARAYTGRTKFIKFEGHYHGWVDNVFFSFHPEKDEDFGTRENPKPVIHGYSKGIPKNILENVIVLPWNNLEYVKKAFKEHRNEIACVITEPIMSNCGVIFPKPGYLEGLKKICDENGALLIFDETITGGRVSLGGAQEFFGVTPHISLGWKSLGGGIPIFCYGSTKEIMRPVSERLVVHAGTFNANPIGCAAAIATLKTLKKNKCEKIKKINEFGKYMMKEIKRMGKKYNISIRVEGPGSFFGISFHDKEIFDMRDFFSVDVSDKYYIFSQLLLDRGIHIFPTDKGLLYLSTAHTEKDIEKTLDVINDVFKIMGK
ncbi:MAG: aspartate aminotransferase family protein [Candidatus Ratteibacteria bacterium]